VAGACVEGAGVVTALGVGAVVADAAGPPECPDVRWAVAGKTSRSVTNTATAIPENTDRATGR